MMFMHGCYTYVLFPVDFVLGSRGVSPLESYDQWRGWADGKVCCDYAFHMGLTWWGPQVSDEMSVLVKEKGELCWDLDRTLKVL